jgi:two-component system, NarL family, response regulator LiaR
MLGALQAGAVGYVRKDAESELLLEAVRAAARGQSLRDPAVASSALWLLAHGRTNREIAAVLTIGEETPKTHVANILSKLRLSHRSQAIVYALKQGIVSLDEL